jgi:hypothetical protein
MILDILLEIHFYCNIDAKLKLAKVNLWSPSRIKIMLDFKPKYIHFHEDEEYSTCQIILGQHDKNLSKYCYMFMITSIVDKNLLFIK